MDNPCFFSKPRSLRFCGMEEEAHGSEEDMNDNAQYFITDISQCGSHSFPSENSTFNTIH